MQRPPLSPPGSVLGDAGVSFPFSVGGGLRRRMERHQELFGTEAVVERSNYLELRGSAFRGQRYQARAALPPVVVPHVIPAPAPALSTPAASAPASPALAASAPATAPPKAPAQWHVVDTERITRTLTSAPPPAPERNYQTWSVVNRPANLPAAAPALNTVDVAGVLTATTPGVTAATSLPKVVLNAAIWAALLTGIFAAAQAFVLHH
jgi:hypothetical protein